MWLASLGDDRADAARSPEQSAVLVVVVAAVREEYVGPTSGPADDAGHGGDLVTRVRTLEDFWRLIGEAVDGPGGYFGTNLDAFADCLSGGFGQPDDDDYVIEWREHQVSREYLGYPETARQLEIRLSRCHPENRPAVRADLTAARTEHGPTVFDWLVTIFEERAPGVLRLR